MAEHGYLREYGEDWDRDEDRGRWRGEDRDRGLLFNRNERDPGTSDRDHERGFLDRMGHRAREMFRDDDRQYPSTHDERRSRDHPERSRRQSSVHPDHHYLSWRDKQIAALDRDYADYCREREQQFHQEFDSWRQNRQSRARPEQASGGSSDEVMELNNPTRLSGEVQSSPSPTADATLGTNNSENSEMGL